MPRRRRYLDSDVLTEARRRIRHVYDTFDSVVVCFSGGKDSLTVLHLAWEAAQELGLDHVDVVFRDEELIPQCVVDFVDEYRTKSWVRMHYFCYPLQSSMYVLGKVSTYVQWDPGREHCRPMPEHALRPPPGDSRVFDQYSMDEVVAGMFPGKVALVNGIRAAESITRLAASVMKLNENWINASATPKAKLCKPIFDWSEDDVFRYFYDQRVAYCQAYDNQLFGRALLRVSTPLHAESAKQFHKLRAIDPVLYQQVIDVFPEMLAHERYFRDIDRRVADDGAEVTTLQEVAAWVAANVTDPQQLQLARKFLANATRCHAKNPRAYPVGHIFRALRDGSFKRVYLKPLRLHEQAKWQEKYSKSQPATP